MNQLEKYWKILNEIRKKRLTERGKMDWNKGEPFLGELISILYIVLFFVGIWLLVKFWEGFFSFVFAGLGLIILLFILKEMWRDSYPHDNDADEGSDY